MSMVTCGSAHRSETNESLAQSHFPCISMEDAAVSLPAFAGRLGACGATPPPFPYCLRSTLENAPRRSTPQPQSKSTGLLRCDNNLWNDSLAEKKEAGSIGISGGNEDCTQVVPPFCPRLTRARGTLPCVSTLRSHEVVVPRQLHRSGQVSEHYLPLPRRVDARTRSGRSCEAPIRGEEAAQVF